MLRRVRVDRTTVTLPLTLVIGPAVLDDICVRCSVEVGLGLDRKAVIVWLTPSASMNCSRSSIFVLPLATVCCVHAVREKAFGDAGGTGWCQRDFQFLYRKFGDREKREKESETDDVEMR